MKKAIVTVLLGKYDELKPAPKFKGWDTILVTDHHYPDKKGWVVNKVKSSDPQKDSRYYKWLTHQYLDMYQLVCYIDASMELKQAPPETPTWYKHPMRESVDQESRRIMQINKAPKVEIQNQIKAYQEAGFVDTYGMYQNGFFVRNHAQDINYLCQTVYETVVEYSNRDQLALPYAIYKTGIYPQNIRPGAETRKYVTIHPHNPLHKRNTALKDIPAPTVHQVQKPLNGPAVHHITPGSADKNLGKAVNTIVNALPNQDWVCFRDIDTMPAYHEKFFQQCEEIAAQGKFGLVSCITNRLGLRYQLHQQKLSQNTDWLYHREIAKKRYQQYKSTVTPTDQTLGGLMLMFPVKVFKEVGGFPEGGIMIDGSFFDYHFSIAVKNARYKLGIANGIYLIHMYRPDFKTPRANIKHLL